LNQDRKEKAMLEGRGEILAGRELTEITPEIYKACKDALAIFEGAVNSLAISNTLAKVYDAFRSMGTDAANNNPAARLILEQLVYLQGSIIQGGMDCFEASKWCQDVVANYEAALHPGSGSARNPRRRGVRPRRGFRMKPRADMLIPGRDGRHFGRRFR
jgi:hypothetical protein